MFFIQYGHVEGVKRILGNNAVVKLIYQYPYKITQKNVFNVKLLIFDA
jgi:hypothetical protein